MYIGLMKISVVKNASHTLAYSLVGLQEMNLAFKNPIIFWNCACLITDSGGAEEEDEEEIVDIYEPEDFTEYEYEDAEDRKTKKKKKRSNNYDKIATAIGKMRSEGIEVAPPDINTSQYTFYPDVDNNKILFGLRGLLNVGDDVIAATIENRPYSSPRDYLNKVKPKKSSMISLIKAGAFDSMMDRKLCMAWYLWEVCDKKQRLTLQNMPSLMKYNLVPDTSAEFVLARRVYEFNRYLKAITKADPAAYKDYYTLDARAIDFMQELELDNIMTSDNLAWFVKCKDWDKIYQKYMDIFRSWLSNDKEKILTELNSLIFKEEWDKYAKGNLSSWEMEVICYYQHDHELAHLDASRYGFSDYFKLPEDPEVDRSFYKGGKEINIFKLTKICGTCIAKDKSKGTVTLLTPTGVVTAKLHKEAFALYDRQISEKQEDGTKKIIEKSWFTRGNHILIQGIRSGDQFIAKKYAASGMKHTVMKITEVFPNGEIAIQTERLLGENS